MKIMNALLGLTTAIVCACLLALPAAPAFAGDGNGEKDPQCVGDVNGDGVVNVLDIIAVLSDWGCMGDCEGDVNGDGMVNALDVLTVLSNWGPCDDGTPLCESAGDCDDGDPCTINLCIGGTCVTFPNPACN